MEPVRGFLAGQGAGKSKVGAFDLLQRVRPGRTYMVTGPTYPVLSQSTVRTFLEVARHFDRLVRVRKGDDPSAIVRCDKNRWGRGIAEIMFRSTMFPDRLRGPNLSGVWMDEASLSPYESYQILIARLREAGELGWLSATFTPKGLTHWTYNVFGEPRPGIFLVHARTEDNPFIAEAFVAQVKATYEGALSEQELGGRFVQVDGAAFDASYFMDHIWYDQLPLEQLRLRVLALDPAQGKGEQGCYASWVCVSVYQTLPGLAQFYVDAWMSQHWDAVQMVRKGKDLGAVLKPDWYSYETVGGQHFLGPVFASEFGQQFLPLKGFNPRLPKEQRIKQLGSYLERKQLHFHAGSPGAKLLVAQLRDFPAGEFVDGPDALHQALMVACEVAGEKR